MYTTFEALRLSDKKIRLFHTYSSTSFVRLKNTLADIFVNKLWLRFLKNDQNFNSAHANSIMQNKSKYVQMCNCCKSVQFVNVLVFSEMTVKQKLK